VTAAATFEVRSPLDGSRLAEVPVYDARAVAEAVARARAAQPAWAALGARARARRMEALAGVLRRRSDEIAQLVRRETGKPFG
jgi:acyl-CoA reductase-like NAD-dependent aldehyde dehydrogenase